MTRGCGVSDNEQGRSALLSLEAVNLCIHDTRILQDICFELAHGDTLGIIGESGSGKSLTALSIMQLLPRGSMLSGHILFDGLALNELDEPALCALRGGDIGMVFQEPMTALNPVKTIGEQVSESIRLHRQVSKRDALELTRQTLQRVGLPPAQFPLNRYPHELSGGQRQRVVIAIAIACRPRLLIADEPTTALDVTTQAGILELLKTLQREDGLALILITHDLAVVSNVVDKIVVMNQGRIVEDGLVRDVLGNPQNAYTETLVEASVLTQLTRHPGMSDGADTEAASIASTQPLLTVNDLVCEYRMHQRSWLGLGKRFRAVDQISFSVDTGECVGLVGESGCGKSTLTRALLGLMPISAGSVCLQGETVSDAAQVSRRARQLMQVVFQDPYGSFNPRHKVHRLVAEPLHVLDTRPSKKQARVLVAEVLESVGLQAADGEKYIHEFSGGQRQRIAIARALVNRPRLIILDEAVSALDVSVRAQVLALLESLAEQYSLAYLFISHDLSVVQRVTDRLLVMRAGKIVEHGKTHQVFNSPAHPYTQALIEAAPKLKI